MTRDVVLAFFSGDYTIFRVIDRVIAVPARPEMNRTAFPGNIEDRHEFFVGTWTFPDGHQSERAR